MSNLTRLDRFCFAAASLAALSGGVWCSPALAQVHAGDIILAVQDGRIVTGQADTSGQITFGLRVFTSTLGGAFPNFSDNPGFDCVPGTFPAGTRNGFTIRRALREWTGSDFAQIPDEVMRASFATLERFSPLTDTPVTGFSLAVSSNGQWHRHLEWTLQAPAEPGIYLLELELWSTSPSILPSDPFWIVFGQNRSTAEIEAAAQWLRDTLNPPSCIGDWDGNGEVEPVDIRAFFDAYRAGEADADGNGETEPLDIRVFFDAYRAGC